LKSLTAVTGPPAKARFSLQADVGSALGTEKQALPAVPLKNTGHPPFTLCDSPLSISYGKSMIVCWQRVTPTDIFERGEKSSVHSAEMRGNPLFPRGMYDKLLTVSKSRVKF